jgi:TRAP-type C4-dicarboxylate transport system permease small subunit
MTTDRPSARQAAAPIEAFEQGFDRVLKALSGLLVAGMLGVLLLAVTGRKLGISFSWYDEVAAILLAWLTYIGAALVALHRGHIGMGSLAEGGPPALRVFLVLLRSALITGFFLVLAWHGWKVMQAMAGFSLITVPWIPVAASQSIIPIGALLFILAECLATRRVLLGLPRLGDGEEVPA